MQGRKTIKILATVTILVIMCVAITYVKSDTKEVVATTKEFNSENLQENEHMHIEEDASEDKVPVPNGYVGSKATGENEIDTGYVIYEGEEEVNDSNVEEAQKIRNQYVWIPVPDASKMYGTNANGKKWGKLYNFATNSNNTNYDEITGTYPLNWSENNGVMKINDVIYGNREPYIVINRNNDGYDIDSRLKISNIETKLTHDFLNELEQKFNNMIDSVEKYGGFYVGRYETGNLSKENVVVRQGNTDIDDQTWYALYNKCMNLKKDNTNIETGVIWGCQWDRILIWLIESGNKNKEEITNSTSWGNYANSEFEYKNSQEEIVVKKVGNGMLIPTGSSEYTKANNIYDLAGNVYDWTMESYHTYVRNYRGGYYRINGNTYGSNMRGGNAPNVKNTYGCRAMLYIK